ncbi:MAG: glycoside hydrolase family 97 protein [Gemmataceae bacterium]
MACSAGWANPAAGNTTSVQSPNGHVRIELILRKEGQDASVPFYRVYFKDHLVLSDSRLGLELAKGALGVSCSFVGVECSSRRATYAIFPGKRKQGLDYYTEAVLSLREEAPPRRLWELVIRAYDDGVAFRYRFPKQDGWPELIIGAERTEFALPKEASVFALPLNSFTTSYEKLYEKKKATAIPKDWLLGLPLLVQCPGAGWLAVTEASLSDYAGLYLATATEGQTTLVGRLSPLPKEPTIAVRAKMPHVSPWRVVLLGDEPGRLIESDLILNLNDPCVLPDTSWIRPGKTTFPWWNGYHEEKVRFEPGLNTATMKYYIDFCAEAGIPYHSLDGKGDTAWYGGPIVPYKGADITQAVAGLDLPEVLKYAKAKQVGIRLWMHWQAAKAHMDRAFPLYKKWGIEGVMIDFMDRDDQEMVNFLRALIEKAAENHLTVTLHGVSKPTGLERTYPNLLTSEGVLNLEYDKWDKVGCPPEHEVTVAFTRMLAGPLDFHQGSFRTVRVEDFKPHYEAPNIAGTAARTLASYVVFQNHLSMVADYPSAYRGHPGLPVLAKIPATWDETKVLSGVVGEYIVIARKRGDEWYIGAMNDRKARKLVAPLTFLSAGPYRAISYGDNREGKKRDPFLRREEIVTAQDKLEIVIDPAGGQLVHLTPVVGKKGNK